MIVDEYRIERLTQGCAGCGREFQVEEEFHSSIQNTGECFQRQDFCASCFTEERIANSFSRWKTRILKPDRPQAARLDLVRIRDFLEKLIQSEDPRHQEMSYVLALILMRKKKLKIADEASLKRLQDQEIVTIVPPSGKKGKKKAPDGDGPGSLRLLDPKTAKIFHVPLPGELGDAKVEELNEELIHLLSLPVEPGE